MNIIVIGKTGSQTRTIKLGPWSILIAALLILAPLSALVFYSGQYLARMNTPLQVQTVMTAWQDEMKRQREEVQGARRKVDEDMDALALRLGELQAKVIRLDALGSRLTEMAKLDRGEFDFSKQPAVGGPESGTTSAPLSVPSFVEQLNSLSQQLDDRGEQLVLLETMLMNRNLQAEVRPAGMPVMSGWTSSGFGMRTDPFTGRPEHHKGMDFAGKPGSDIIAVGAGVVTWSGERFGYGKLVEVNHGNGYATRYGHCEEILVSVGDTVGKGQVLALMGSTGRSTGPHVHFEVLYKGNPVNPSKYALAGS
jgi:murein DD-endopeptidase MepM/ murein hydrolase activator NlpD